MKCNQCGLENPKQSKFCRKCGTPLGARLRCTHCSSENPGDSLFCIDCGEKLLATKKPVKGTQPKCRNCGHFNELDALFCVACGEEIVKAPREDQREEHTGPSYKTIALIVAMVFLMGILVTLGMTFFRGERASKVSSASMPATTSLTKLDETEVIAVARNFKCACEGCGELPLEACGCDMPKGAVEEKNFIRQKLAEGFTVEQVTELLDKKYGHRV